MTWTDPGEIVDRWVGPNPPALPDDHSMLALLIEDAERVVVAEDPTIPDRLYQQGDPRPDRPLPVETFRQVVARMVIRHLRNPDGIRQMSEVTGPFTQARTYAGDSPGELELTVADRTLLGLDGRSQTAFTISPGGHRQTGWAGYGR